MCFAFWDGTSRGTAHAIQLNKPYLIYYFKKPLQGKLLERGKSLKKSMNLLGSKIKEIYKKTYTGPIVSYLEAGDEEGFLSSVRLQNKDSMIIEVYGNEDRILLVARYDNLGKGASGAAVECLNIVLGEEKTKTLVI